MRIPLNEFEQIINETILKRGLSYFKKGHVTDLSEIYNGAYEAQVSGTEEYTVQLEIDNNTIVKHNCDCPYDMGPICKHIVAVIFYLQQDLLGLFPKKNTSKTKKKKTKSVIQQVKEILNALSHEELKDFVRETSKNDRKFRNIFMASFDHLGKDRSKEFYQKQLNSILKTAAGRDGWIGWSDMKYVVNATEPFLINAKKYAALKNYQNAIFICTALLEEMTEAFQYGDDSNGDLGYFIDSAMEILSEIASKKIPVNVRDELFRYCISVFEKGIFSGWDWHLGILHIACKLIENDSEVNTVLECIDTIHKEYERERAQSFKLTLLQKFRSQKEVDTFIEQHISNPSIRHSEIAKAVQDENFERAIKLSKDGIKYDEKDRPGLVKDWYNCLLKIAQSQNNASKIIEYARFLFIDDFGAEQDYYQLLKNKIEDKNWHPFVEEIIKDITTNPKRHWVNTDLIRKIYIKESWWDRLFHFLGQNCSLGNIEENEHYLSKDYAPELIGLYGKHITGYVKEHIGRSHYRTACRYLRRMKKLGGNDQVIEIIESFRTEYPQRRALMDELNRV